MAKNDANWPTGLKNGDLFGLFASPCSSAFHAVCSLIVRGVAASPSKARKRISCLKFFRDIYRNNEAISSENNAVVHQYNAVLSKHTGDGAKNTQPDTADVNPEEIKMKYMQICEGLRCFSQRLSHFSIDELLTLAVLMDINNDGIVDFTDFHEFCVVVDQSQHSHVNPTHCFECLFLALLQQKTDKVTSLPKLEAALLSLRENMIPTMPLLLENLREQGADVEVTPAILGDIFQSVMSSLEKRDMSGDIGSSISARVGLAENKSQIPVVSPDEDLWLELGELRERSQILLNRLNQKNGLQDYGGIVNALMMVEREIEKAHPANRDTYVNSYDQNEKKSPKFKQSPIHPTSTSSPMNISNLSVVTSTTDDSHGFRHLNLPLGNGTPVARSGNSLRRESLFVQRTMEQHRKAVNDMAPYSSNPSTVSLLFNGNPENTLPGDGGSINSILNSSMSSSTRRRSTFSPKSHFQATNLSIFKGPTSHIHGNKNTYDSKKHSWKPSSTPPKDERFQTANDLRKMEKVSKFLYNIQ